MPKRYNWLKVKTDFLSQENPDPKEIARVHDLSYYTLRNKIYEEDWYGEHREHRARLEEKVKQNLIDSASGEYEKFNRLYQKCGGLIVKRAAEYLQNNREIPPTVLDKLANAIRKSQEIVRTSYGKDIPVAEFKITHNQILNVLNEYRNEQKKLEEGKV